MSSYDSYSGEADPWEVPERLLPWLIVSCCLAGVFVLSIIGVGICWSAISERGNRAEGGREEGGGDVEMDSVVQDDE